MPFAAQPLIRWTSRFDTGHGEIDTQHKALVELLNRFAADLQNEGGQQTQLFDLFKETLREHFQFEESALKGLGVTRALLKAHSKHHGDSMQLLEALGHQLANDPREYSSAVLAEIAHCLLVDLLDEDRYCFVTAATKPSAAATPPIEPALQAFKRLFDVLNEHNERVAQARDYYLTLLDDFPTPICRADTHGEFDWFNRTWLSLTGKPLAEAASGGWLDAIHADDRNVVLASWRRNFAARVPFTTEYRLADASGSWCWIHQIGHPFFDSSHRFLGYICTLFDITERRAHEASLRVSAAVFEHAHEAIMITDADGRIEAINPAFTRITGYTTAEAVSASSNLLRSGLHDNAFYASLWQAVVGQGRWQGEIVNRRKNGEVFPTWLSITTIRNTDGDIVRMVGVFSDIASTRASQERLMHLAHHDTLTGLPNRLLFDARAQHSLERCAREESRLAILFIDLDNFKPVNDLLGHKAGDRTLRDVAEKLRGALRAEDTVARFGGDEFVVLVERAQSLADAKHVAEKLQAIFPIKLAGNHSAISIGASIGMAIYPDAGSTVDDLIEAADQDMYVVKRGKKAQVGS